MAGSTVGGGTRVNWNVSFRTPEHVRQDWAAMGLPHFASERYTASLDAVCSRLGVGTGGIISMKQILFLGLLGRASSRANKEHCRAV